MQLSRAQLLQSHLAMQRSAGMAEQGGGPELLLLLAGGLAAPLLLLLALTCVACRRNRNSGELHKISTVKFNGSGGFNFLFIVLVDDGLKMMEDSKDETANSETEDLCCELPLKRQHKYHDEV